MSGPTVDHAAFTYVTRLVTSLLFIADSVARVAVVQPSHRLRYAECVRP